jgi:hypothetical protein
VCYIVYTFFGAPLYCWQQLWDKMITFEGCEQKPEETLWSLFCYGQNDYWSKSTLCSTSLSFGVRVYFDKTSPSAWIDWPGSIIWQTGTSNSTTANILLWSYIKDKAYQHSYYEPCVKCEEGSCSCHYGYWQAHHYTHVTLSMLHNDTTQYVCETGKCARRSCLIQRMLFHIYSSVHFRDKTTENVIETLCTGAHWTSQSSG